MAITALLLFFEDMISRLFCLYFNFAGINIGRDPDAVKPMQGKTTNRFFTSVLGFLQMHAKELLVVLYGRDVKRKSHSMNLAHLGNKFLGTYDTGDDLTYLAVRAQQQSRGQRIGLQAEAAFESDRFG